MISTKSLCALAFALSQRVASLGLENNSSTILVMAFVMSVRNVAKYDVASVASLGGRPSDCSSSLTLSAICRLVIASSMAATVLASAALMITGSVINGVTASRYASWFVTRFLAQLAVTPIGASTQPRTSSTMDSTRHGFACGPRSIVRQTLAAPDGAAGGTTGSAAVAGPTAWFSTTMGAVGACGSWGSGSSLSDMTRTSV